MSYSIILPTLNEEGHIIDLIKEIAKNFIDQQSVFEIIIVDDNSTDGTIEKISNFIKTSNIEIKLYVRNEKKNLAASINFGIDKSKYENIIWMDADFQHPPVFLKLFQKHQSKYDIVIFSRFLKNSIRYFENEKFKKDYNQNQSVFFNKLCNRILYRELTDYTSGFICIKKKIFENYELKGYYGEYFIDLLIYCKFKNFTIIELPFVERERYSGISKTFPNFSFNYLILLYVYFLSLMKNFFKKILLNIFS
tara:strand:- start:134 stop:886 length:753 start_codon:yes stop_codon:yes gene_type:complete